MIGLGKYNLLLKLGQGGMGTVYLARQKTLRRFCVIKVISPQFSQDRESVERFLREARTTASLSHPNLVTVFDCDQFEGQSFIAMEYVEGMSLGEILRKRGALPVPLALFWLNQAAVGLEYIHGKNLIHRDIKPDNMIVDGGGVLKIMDLGLAKDHFEADQSMTMAGTMMGSPHYMSPEQIHDSKTVDHRSDLYSLGVSFYQMVVGGVPFRQTSTAAVCMAHLHEPMPSVGLPDAGLTQALDALILRMTAKDKAERFQSVAEWLAALAPWIANYPMDEAAQEFFGKLELAQRKVAVLLEKEGIPLSEVDANFPSAAPQPGLNPDPQAGGASPSPPGSAAGSLSHGAKGGESGKRDISRKPMVWACAAGLLVVVLGLAGWYWSAHLSTFAKATADKPSEKAGLAKIGEVEKEKVTRVLPADGVAAPVSPAVSAKPAAAGSPSPPAANPSHLKPMDDQSVLSKAARLATAPASARAVAGEETPQPGTEKEKSKTAQMEAEKQALTVALQLALGFKKDGEWANIVAALEDPLKAPGAVDHPNRKAAEALLSQARAEIKKRADFADALRKADGLLAAKEFAAARAAYKEAGKLWAESPDLAKVETGLQASAKGEMVQCTKKIDAFDLKNPGRLVGVFQPQSTLEIEEFVATARMYRVKYKMPNGTEVQALCRPEDLGKGDAVQGSAALPHSSPGGGDPQHGGSPAAGVTEQARPEEKTVEPGSPRLFVSGKWPRKGTPWVNTLGMKFVPMAGMETELFCIWETRVQDYKVFVKATERHWAKADFVQGPDHPAVNVSWDDAQAFCKWLTEKERKEGVLDRRQEYRLLTLAEWSRAVGPGKYPWGDEFPPPKGAGNYSPSLKVDDFENTSPVGSFAANKFGLYDMGGNAWEWCEDGADPKTKNCVLRGASWNFSTPVHLAVSCRYAWLPASRLNFFGFRCVVVVTSSP